jgi:hypothetical protein
MKIAAGRHPVIENLAQREAARFIPNDLYLNSESKFIAVITGPNMGGKSTYLRQAALIVPSWPRPDRSYRRTARCSPSPIASSPGSAPPTIWRAAAPPSWLK